MALRFDLPRLGFGVGLRAPLVEAALTTKHGVEWFEFITENVLFGGALPRRNLARIHERFTAVPHGVSLSIASPDPLDRDYLSRLKTLVRELGAPWVSDHLCFTSADGIHVHELVPVPRTLATARYVASRARQVQDYLEVPLALENVSSYLDYRSSDMPDAEFVSTVAELAGCALLLDVNNVIVAARHHAIDPVAYVAAMDPGRVVQLHLAGHDDSVSTPIDTHDRAPNADVWALYRFAKARFPEAATLLEWDASIPSLHELDGVIAKARAALPERRDEGFPKERSGRPAPTIQTQVAARAASDSLGKARPPPRLVSISRRVTAALANPPKPLADEAAARDLRPSLLLAPKDQLRLYRQQFEFRHLEALADDHPALAAVMGRERFERLVDRYLRAHPPKHASLNALGADFLPFALRHRHLLGEAGTRSLALDVLHVERAVADAFDARVAHDAPEPRPRGAPRAAAADVESLDVSFAPGATLLALEHGAHLLCRRFRTEADRSRANEANAHASCVREAPSRSPRLSARKTWLLVTRNPESLRATITELGQFEFELLRALAQGVALGSASARAARAEIRRRGRAGRRGSLATNARQLARRTEVLFQKLAALRAIRIGASPPLSDGHPASPNAHELR